MRHFTVVGCYGEGNLGDEAILAGIKHLVTSWVPDATFSIFIGSEAYASHYSEPTILDLQLVKIKHWYGLFLKGRIIPLLSSIREADAVVIGGGELIRDDFGILPLLGVIEKALLAKLFRKKLLLLGVGTGRIDTRIGYIAVRSVLMVADAVVVRDQQSQKKLQSIYSRKKIATSCDVAFSLPPLNQSRFSSGEKWVAVSLRDWPTAWTSNTISKEQQGVLFTQFVEKLAAVLKTLQEKNNCGFLFIPFRIEPEDDDRSTISEVIIKGGLERCQVVDYCGDPLIVKSTIAACTLMIGMRLHACILALSAGVPTVAINYDDKINKIMAELDMTEFVIDIYRPNYETYLRTALKCSQQDTLIIKEKVADISGKCIFTYHECLKTAKGADLYGTY